MTDTNTSQAEKPWGDDENFDADRAWTLIQNLREENATLKEDKASIATSRDEITQKLEEAQAAAQLADDEAKAKATEVLSLTNDQSKLKLLAGANLPLDFVDTIKGETEDDWKASVERLNSLRNSGGVKPDPAQSAPDAADTEDDLRSIFFD